MTKNHSAELQAKATDNAAFDELIVQLRADRSIRQPELREIAIAFIGYQIANSTPRGKALQKIIDRQMVDARQTARGAVLDRSLNAW